MIVAHVGKIFARISLVLLLTAISSVHSWSAESVAKKLAARISNLTEIKLRSGVNDVELAGIGVEGKIIKAIVEDVTIPNGHNTYLVMRPSPLDKQRWDLVPIAGDLGRDQDVIEDEPHTGEDAVKTVRFFNGSLDGRPATLMFVAHRRLIEGYGSPGPTRISVYDFETPKEDNARQQSFIVKLQTFLTIGRYGGADYALWKELSIPLPEDFQH